MKRNFCKNWGDHWYISVLQKKKCNSELYKHYFAINKPMYKYLDVKLSSNCSWNAHMDDVIVKARSALNFIQRNSKWSHGTLKETANITCVRPILEYTYVVSDPAQIFLTDRLEKKIKMGLLGLFLNGIDRKFAVAKGRTVAGTIIVQLATYALAR